MTIEASLITDDDDLLALRPEWEQLWSASGALPFQHFDWVMTAWRRRQLRFPNGPLVALVRDNGRLVVAAPLFKRQQWLVFHRYEALRTQLPQYGDVLVAPEGDGPTWMAALLKRLGQERGARGIYFDLLPKPSPLAEALAPLARRQRVALRTSGADLSGGFEPYFASFSGSARWEYRRRLKGMEEAGGMRLTLSTAETLREDYQWMMRSKRAHKPRGARRLRKWMRLGESNNDLRAICLDWIGSDKLMLATLWIGGKRAAANLVFAGGGQAIGYLITHDPQCAAHSPGRMLVLLTMEHAAKAGIKRFDLMAGQSDWKDRLNTAPLSLVEISARLPR